MSIAEPVATIERAPPKREKPGPLEYLRRWPLQAIVGATLIFLYAPLITLMAFSFNTSRRNIVWEGFTLDWYGRAMNDDSLVQAFVNSLTIALQSSSGTRTYVVTSGTKVDRAREGTTSDVKKGSTVLVKNFTNDQGHLEASEIVVLPDSTRLGTR